MNRLILVFALMFMASNSYASDFTFKPYVGASYDYLRVSYDNTVDPFLDDSLNGFDIHAGARINKYFGIEASYLWTADGEQNNAGTVTKVNVRGFALDGMGYLPVNDKFELIGTAGITRYRANIALSGLVAGSGSDTETKWRIGAGGQYWLTDKVNARALVRYQAADYSGLVDNAMIGNIGLNFQF